MRAVLVPLVVRLLEQEGTDRVVDLCSGGSGPWEYLTERVTRARRDDGTGSFSVTPDRPLPEHPRVPRRRLPDRPAELAAMVEGLGGADYRWEAGELPATGSTGPITYVIGYPVSRTA